MNQIKYRQAAIELGKIPGMERSPWSFYVCNKNCRGDWFKIHDHRTRDREPSHGCGYYAMCLGPWLNIDDFSEWSAAKIANAINKFAWERCKDGMAIDGDVQVLEANALRARDGSNLEVIQFIIEAYKINPAAVIATLPKENQ